MSHSKILLGALFLSLVSAVHSSANAGDPVNCSLVTDYNVKSIPSTPKPYYLSPIIDPTFKTRITRISDDAGRSFGSVSGSWGTAVRHHYSKDQAWNADESLLFIDRNVDGSPSGNIFLDGRTYKPLFSGKPSGEVRWDRVNPDLMVYVSGSDVGKFNVRTKAIVSKRSFSGYSSLRLGPSEGNLSNDGKMLVVSGTRAADGKVVAFAYNLETNTKYADIDVDAFASDLDWASISPLGKYVVIQYDEDEVRVFTLNGSLVQHWPERGQPSHFDMTVDLDGVTELAVGVDKAVNKGRVIKRRLIDGVVTVLTKGGWVSHTSARNLKRPGWVYGTVQRPTSDGYGIYDSEIIAVKLDGSVTQRLGHHQDIKVDYLSETHASPSPDGRRVIFVSNWQNGGGHISTYVIDLCPNTAAPAPTATPGPTATPMPTPASTPAPVSTPRPSPTPTSSPVSGSQTISSMPLAYSDDAEENLVKGYVDLKSSDLEMVTDGSTVQMIGIRFPNLAIPKGAVINSAYIQFTADEVGSVSTNLKITGQAVENAPTFEAVSRNISSRARTAAAVPWSPSAWNVAKEAGAAQRSPNLAAIVQEVVNRSGWTSGNAMAFLVEGSGSRVAKSVYYAGLQPKLVVNYSTGTTSGGSSGSSDTTAPTVTLSSPLDGAIVKGTITLAASASDNVGVASVDFRWDSESFGAPDTTAPYSHTWDTTKFADGYYTLSALARDAAGNTKISNIATVKVANASVSPTPPPSPTPSTGSGATLRVPQDYSSIQAAINAARSGDTVLVSPGTYAGGLTISGKSITLASLFLTTGSKSYVDQTTIDNGSPIISIAESAANSRIIGLRLINGVKGVQCFGHCTVSDSNFDNVGSDQMSLEGAGGIIKNNRFYSASDDAIDCDGPHETLIEGNSLIDSGDDGIEIRNFSDTSSAINVVIRGNTISGSREDGIQIIDYSGTSHRRFVIERNLILGSADAGIGLMDSGETIEDFRAASMTERIHVFNNTLSGNRYGITGGDNSVVVNNIIANCSVMGIKNVDGQSVVSHNMFYNNGTHYSGSNVNTSTTKIANPMFTSTYRPQSDSPAVDAGVSSFSYGGEVVLRITSFAGTAPDMGCFDY